MFEYNEIGKFLFETPREALTGTKNRAVFLDRDELAGLIANGPPLGALDMTYKGVHNRLSLITSNTAKYGYDNVSRSQASLIQGAVRAKYMKPDNEEHMARAAAKFTEDLYALGRAKARTQPSEAGLILLVRLRPECADDFGWQPPFSAFKDIVEFIGQESQAFNNGRKPATIENYCRTLCTKSRTPKTVPDYMLTALEEALTKKYPNQPEFTAGLMGSLKSCISTHPNTETPYTVERQREVAEARQALTARLADMGVDTQQAFQNPRTLRALHTYAKALLQLEKTTGIDAEKLHRANPQTLAQTLDALAKT